MAADRGTAPTSCPGENDAPEAYGRFDQLRPYLIPVAPPAVVLALLALLGGAAVGAALIAATILIIATLIEPAWPLLAVVVISPFYFVWNSLLTSGQVGFITRISPIDLLVVLAIVGAISTRPSSLKHVRPRAIDVVCAAWCLVAAAALAHGLWSGYEAAFRAARGPLLWVLYFPAVLLIDRTTRRQWLVNAMLTSAGLVGIIGILGSIGALTSAFPKLPVGIVGGVLTRPNFFAEPSLTIPYLLLVLLLFAARRPSHVERLAWIGIGLLDTAVLMISVTRGFWLGMIGAVLCLIALLGSRGRLTLRGARSIALGTVGALIVVEVLVHLTRGFSLVQALVERLQTTVGGDPQSVDFRLSETVAYFASFLESPIMGNGFGSPVTFDLKGATAGFAHDQYVFLLQTTGLVGGVTFASLLLLAVREAFLKMGKRHFALGDVTPLLLVATIAGFAVTSVTSPELTNVTTVPLLAILTAAVRMQQPASESRVS